jgi:hypothetical protein
MNWTQLSCNTYEISWKLVQTTAINTTIIPAPGNYDAEIGGMMIDRETEVLGKKPFPVLLCPPQTPPART